MRAMVFMSFILFSFACHADVLDLGNIGGESQLLDQRLILEVTEHQRLQSLGEYYKFQKDDLVRLMGQTTTVYSIEPYELINQRWNSLIEGTP